MVDSDQSNPKVKLHYHQENGLLRFIFCYVKINIYYSGG